MGFSISAISAVSVMGAVRHSVKLIALLAVLTSASGFIWIQNAYADIASSVVINAETASTEASVDTATGSAAQVPAQALALVGSWQLVSGRYLNEKHEWVDYQSLNLSAIKVISARHFSFTTMKNVEGVSQFWAAGSGTYQATATEYTERPELNSFGATKGAEFVFSYAIKGQELHTQRVENGELKEVEVWQRLD
ncbi:hypothetical protein Sbal183_1523 [Shewanella baltica OS183]|uniref:hypothetical protein n=1 Tax=Shewanella baltica TaxID=62322 RepID=UPI0001E10FFD|nr:hypothetical protein [Shewanella baltica]AEG12019.1 hypothetical protein Sbal175_2776 [Shewanella baltica BA175]EHQ14445.1 hypothetical protein Sbal183_1523 [Shewanella baltica OS183]